MATPGGGELARRVGVALIGIPLAVGFGYLGGFWLAGALAVLAGVAAWEFSSMYRLSGVAAVPFLSGSVALALVVLAAAVPPLEFAVSATLLALLVASLVVVGGAPESRPGLGAIVSVFGAAYVGALLAFAIWLRGVDVRSDWRGAAILFLPIAITWLGDTAAYFTGKAIGRHKLAPTISPAKTWEGAVAGFVATAAGALLYMSLTQSTVGWTMTVFEGLGFGAAVAIAGQMGDLVESRFKRDCAVKDSSNILPGHGGVLDRLDSLLFVFPVSYMYVLVVGV